MMLQFWKKDKQKSPHSSPSKVVNGNIHDLSSSDRLEVLCAEALSPNPGETGTERCEAKSRLTLELRDVLTNRSALSYFTQFMEARALYNILCLWLDLEHVEVPVITLSMKNNKSNSFMRQSTEGRCENNEKESVCYVMKQYINDDAPMKVRLPDDLRIEMSSSPLKENFKSSLDSLREYIKHVISKEAWPEFLQSDWHSKYIVEIMTGGTMTISDVLYSDTCLSNFIEFLEQEGLISVIEFWLAASSFEKQFTGDAIDINQMQNDAIIIYEKYVSLESKSRVSLPDKVRIAVEEGICTPEDRLLLEQCFASAIVYVEHMMRDSLLGQYLSSQHYLGLLSDTVMGAPVARPSPPASTSSHDTASTLTDSLHRRNRNPCGLSFGRIDQLGRYVADFEPEPDKKVSGLSRMLKLFSHKEVDKVHEEMAWRVAEMIVKDITNITLGAGASIPDEPPDP